MEEIKPQYEHSKIGNFMFNLCASGTKFLVKYKGLYYLLACTGGFLMTFIGCLITVILSVIKLFNKNITFQKYHGIYCVFAGPDYGGGFEMGLMFVRDQKSSDDYINPHEFGHTFQNCILGPFFPFLVAIPSACRYGARALKPKKVGSKYDSVGFEDAASQCGKFAHEFFKNKTV